MSIHLHDFFKFYDEANPKHRAAVDDLARAMPPALLSDEANWVRIYRTPVAAGPVKTDWSDWDSKVSTYFTVGEAFQWDSFRRQRADAAVRQAIVKLAAKMDPLRDRFGPIAVTSWYRDPETNRRVGGVSNSQHLTGSAADIYPVQYNALEFEDWLDRNWEGGVGYGIRAGRGFTHLDLGPNRRWTY